MKEMNEGLDAGKWETRGFCSEEKWELNGSTEKQELLSHMNRKEKVKEAKVQIHYYPM